MRFLKRRRHEHTADELLHSGHDHDAGFVAFIWRCACGARWVETLSA